MSSVDNTAANEDLLAALAERPDGAVDGDGGMDFHESPPSPTAFVHDSWSHRKGRETFDGSELIKEAYGEFKDTDPLNELINMTTDFFAAAYEPELEFAPNPQNERLAKFMSALVQTPEFRALRSETVLDDTCAEMAAAHFAAAFTNVRVAAVEGQTELQEEIENLKAANESAKKAASDVQEWNDVKQMMGLGGVGADAAVKMPTEEIRKRFDLIRKNDRLRRICQLAGRYRRLAQAMQRRKVMHGRDELFGVTVGGDVEHLLPSELVLLSDPDLELEGMRRIVERSAMQRDFRKVEKVAKGPIVCVVDESGSMDGEPIATAKSIALALYWIARHQKRWICLVGFSGGTQGNFLTIAPDDEKPDELMAWLEHFYAGGTDMDVPLDVLPKRWPKYNLPPGKTDILMITDACVHLPDKLRDSFNEWKSQTQARCQGIVIGRDAGELRQVMDSTYTVDDLGIEQAAVQDALSI